MYLSNVCTFQIEHKYLKQNNYLPLTESCLSVVVSVQLCLNPGIEEHDDRNQGTATIELPVQQTIDVLAQIIVPMVSCPPTKISELMSCTT